MTCFSLENYLGCSFWAFSFWVSWARFGRGGHGRYQSAYQQGFIDGRQAAAAGSEAAPKGAEAATAPVPNQIPGANVYYRGHGFFFPAFGLFFCLVPFFLMGLFFMAIGKRRWHGGRYHRGDWGYHKGGHGPWRHGPCGPRSDWEENPKEKSPDDIDDGSDEPIFRA